MENLIYPALLLLPLLGGAVLLFLQRAGRTQLFSLSFLLTLLTSALSWLAILRCGGESVTLFSLPGQLTLVLRLDGLGRFFTGLIAVLWPLTTLYAFSYMEREERLPGFFGFFLMSFGTTLGVAMAGNLLTLYCFYELLTLSTIPLVLHPQTKAAQRAGKTYMLCSLGGAALGFVVLVYLISRGADGLFTFGGMSFRADNLMRWMYVAGFLGFGVKAAVFPMDFWLPKVSVAPTPVTALLHAVAVVKSGAFALVRLTWFVFGTELLRGSAAQWIPMGLSAFTIVYGSSMALRETHFKRRLAWSTVANLSYILLGITMMTPEGLTAALLHLLFHAQTKIVAFFCAGSVLVNSRREYLPELNGLGRRMPVTFGCFTVAALSLTGIPLFSGFVSKWYLLTAAVHEGSAASFWGAAALLISALLTAMYMLGVSVRAFFPANGTVAEGESREADWRMLVPMVLLSALILYSGCCSGWMVHYLEQISAGLL